MKKDIVAGLGEIGFPIYKIISKVFPVEGYDINPKLIPKNGLFISNWYEKWKVLHKWQVKVKHVISHSWAKSVWADILINFY